MNAPITTGDALRRALAVRDLTNPALGPHAMQLLVDTVVAALASTWSCRVTLHRASPIVSVDDNYDALGFPEDGASRDARYTRWVSDRSLLRTQTSALLPPLLRSRAPDGVDDDELIACPGLVWRRDRIDRLHVGEPHQLDLWRLSRARMSAIELHAMIDVVVKALLPGRRWRANHASHPYTVDGREIEVEVAGATWIEIGECGVANPAVLARAGIDVDRVSGLAMGLGLDRMLMVKKSLDDIRLLRALDPRIAKQMLDLEPYRAVSSLPPMKRDLSIVVDASRTAEEIGDRARDELGDDAAVIEDLAVVSETDARDLPPAARARLRIDDAQKNVLLRLTLRPLDRTLTDDEGNALRDRVYAAVHEGRVAEWAKSTHGRG
jgi:phenylalanyl-tRNA synthetase alpha chain